MAKRMLNTLIAILVLTSVFYAGQHLYNLYQYNKSLEQNEIIRADFYASRLQTSTDPGETRPADPDPEEPADAEPVVREAYLELLERNPDTVGWIRIDDTAIDLPVVQGEDNDYYLHHSYSGGRSASGTIFMDFRNQPARDNNLLIYGHTIRARNMFAELNEYVDPGTGRDRFENQPVIEFDTLYEDGRYRLFSAYIVDLDREDYYLFPHYAGRDFEAFLAEIRSRSLYESDLPVTEDDQILTLVTCWPALDDARTILHAKRIEETP